MARNYSTNNFNLHSKRINSGVFGQFYKQMTISIFNKLSLKKALLFILLFSLTGCTASGPAFVSAPPPKSDEALIYIYRVPSFVFSNSDSKFFLNDVNVANLYSNGYCRFTLPPGVYSFEQKWSWLITGPFNNNLIKPIKFPLIVQEGHTYYIRFAARPGRKTPIGDAIEWRVDCPDPETALKEIKKCKLQKAINIDKL